MKLIGSRELWRSQVQGRGLIRKGAIWAMSHENCSAGIGGGNREEVRGGGLGAWSEQDSGIEGNSEFEYKQLVLYEYFIFYLFYFYLSLLFRVLLPFHPL